MKRLIIIICVLIFSVLTFSIRFELKIPEFDKENAVLDIYTFEHESKIEITVVFWDEDYPNPFINFIYDIYRLFKWGRLYDIETFFVTDSSAIFEDDYANSSSYFQTENLHNYKEIPFDDFQKDGDNIVIYVSTWNHMFSNKPLPNTEYISYLSNNSTGTRNEVEKIYSWKKNKNLKFSFYLSLLVVLLGILTIFFKIKNKNAVILKTLTTFACLLIALFNTTGFEFLIVGGLFFGMLGDIFLEFKEKFLYGMLSFLIGHIFYSIGFSLKFGMPNIFVFLLVYIVLLILYFGILFKNTGDLKIPILVYVLAIGTMFSFSFSPVFKEVYYLRFLLPLAGGLFVLSDLLLAISMFVKDFKYSEVIILGSYFTSQLIIALSTIF
ncbi:MAG: lysoplasmalogenase [Thermosipho sp. (in: Bacteria)]|nr:lysoplasmalogenase [Thermosipho sp. (in: thermotogales)]